jgi:hypothetical protein
MPQPRGTSDYIRQLRNRAIAATYAPRQGISLDASALLSVRAGQRPQVVQPIVGLAYDVSGCCCTPPIEDVGLVAGVPTNVSINGYTYMATVSWNDIGATYYSLSIEYEGSDTNPYAIDYDSVSTSALVLFKEPPGVYTARLTSYKPCGAVTTTAIAYYD